MCRFFVLLNDPEKDIKVRSIVLSRGFFAPKKVNAHGLSNFIESGKNLRKTRLIRSHGFNEPKKVNAPQWSRHLLSWVLILLRELNLPELPSSLTQDR